MEELFRTVHGSHLYGLAHAGSDRDVFIVTDSRRPTTRHTNGPDEDRAVVGISAFLKKAASGSHQSAEAAFSPYLEFTPAGECLRAVLAGLRVAGPDVTAKYERTIKAFSFGDFKRRRHAVRLTQNLAELRLRGRFNPQMSEIQIVEANRLATELADADLVRVLLPGRRI